jgi:hypothetical protein
MGKLILWFNFEIKVNKSKFDEIEWEIELGGGGGHFKIL